MENKPTEAKPTAGECEVFSSTSSETASSMTRDDFGELGLAIAANGRSRDKRAKDRKQLGQAIDPKTQKLRSQILATFPSLKPYAKTYTSDVFWKKHEKQLEEIYANSQVFKKNNVNGDKTLQQLHSVASPADIRDLLNLLREKATTFVKLAHSDAGKTFFNWYTCSEKTSFEAPAVKGIDSCKTMVDKHSTVKEMSVFDLKDLEDKPIKEIDATIVAAWCFQYSGEKGFFMFEPEDNVEKVIEGIQTPLGFNSKRGELADEWQKTFVEKCRSYYDEKLISFIEKNSHLFNNHNDVRWDPHFKLNVDETCCASMEMIPLGRYTSYILNKLQKPTQCNFDPKIGK